MLLSLLLSLTASQEAPILGWLGRPAQAWFLRQVTGQFPALAQSLHDAGGPVPYAVSTLLDARGRPLPKDKWLQPGENCWLRITSYSKSLSDAILEKVLPNLPGKLALYKMDFRLDGYTLDPAQHPWAGQSTFIRLAEMGGMNEENRQARLEFASLTAFRSNGIDIPLPIPFYVFRSYWQKWNAFAPEVLQIQDFWPQFVGDCVVVSELVDLNTERWTFAEGTRGSANGFLGTVKFTLLPQHLAGNLAPVWRGAADVLQTLAGFAFYCGTGHHTTIGMGQTRPLPVRSPQKATQRR